MNGISNAFRKFRKEGDITEEEENAVINFIDQFTTVSLCADEVGKEAARIAEEVISTITQKLVKPFRNADSDTQHFQSGELS